MLELMEWLESTGISTAIREGTLYFPTLDGSHLFGITIMFGSISIFDLRLMGWIFKNESVTEVYDQLIKWTYVGFGVVLISGILLFISEPVRCYASWWFWGKMVLVALGGVNAKFFEWFTYKSVNQWNNAVITPSAARMAGLSSLIIWTAVITVGRFFAFL
jgi:hypothetical protein